MMRFVLLSIYVVVGIYLTFIDSFVLPVYLTILPFHGFLLYKSIKTKNLLFILFSLLTFISYGIGSIFFYLDRENAKSTGYAAIGDFDFSYGQLFSAYSYFAVFLLFLTLFISYFKKKSHSIFLPLFMQQQYEKLISYSKTWSLKPLVLCLGVFLMISLWMFSNHIGMIGLHQTELPFHMTGILFYSRRFLFPIILVYLFFKTKSKNIASVLLIFYALIVGVLATSKSASLIILLPLIYLNYMMGKKMMSLFCFISAVACYVIVGTMRTFIYDMDAEVDIMTIFSSSYNFFPEDRNLFVFICQNITGRLYGLQSTVLGNQYSGLTFGSLIDFYTTSKITDVIPDYVPALFGFELPEGFAFGVGLGYAGTMQLLSCHNYFFAIIQAFIVSVVFCIQNNCVQGIFHREVGISYKYISILIVFLSFLIFYDGNQMQSVYLLTLLQLMVYYIAVKPFKKIGKSVSN